MSRDTRLPTFVAGSRLRANDLNMIVAAVRASLRVSGGSLIADAGAAAERIRPMLRVAKWVRITGNTLKPGTGIGGVPPEWLYSWIEPKVTSAPGGAAATSETEFVDTSTAGGNQFGRYAINGLEKSTGSGSNLKYGVGVLLTQPNGAILTPQPIEPGRECQLHVIAAGKAGGYRFALPNGYSVSCGAGGQAQQVAPTRGDAQQVDPGLLAQILRGLARWQ